MRVLISTFGTRGDIQPFIALGQGLQAAGHLVTLCTSEGFQAWVERHGLGYGWMSNGMLDLTRALLAGTEKNPVRLMRHMSDAMRQMLEEEWAVAQRFQPDLILYHPKMLGSYHIAEKLRIPAILSLPLPFYTPTRAFPNPFLVGVRLGPAVNRLTYQLMGLSSAMYVGLTNQFRVKSLGLPRKGRFDDLMRDAQGAPIPVLYPYSPSLLPIPPDFPPYVHVTGYWFLEEDEGWQPPQALAEFLATGAAPIYIGFGSMGGQSAPRTAIVQEALARTGQRAILASGWGGLGAEAKAPHLFTLEAAPHEWLFPRMAAVVHHGGAGTTAAGLRAGKPTLICPFLGDQPFWGDVIHRAGVGPQPIPQQQLTPARLSAAIEQLVGDATMQQRATEMSARIRAEDGMGAAVRIIERYATKEGAHARVAAV